MKAGGKGGAKTQTGLRFERRKNLLLALAKVPGIKVKGREIFKDGELFAISCRKKALAKFLREKGVDTVKIVSKMLEPDEALFVPSQNKAYIIEMKFQKTAGSVDEKLQTCDFKKKQYQKLFAALGSEVEYIYILNDWFLDKKYTDVLNYVETNGCRYFFNELSLEILGL